VLLIDKVKVKLILEKPLLSQDYYVCYRTPVRFHQMKIKLRDTDPIIIEGEDVEYMSLNLNSLLVQIQGSNVTGYNLKEIESLDLKN
jgi:hypothetical protein